MSSRAMMYRCRSWLGWLPAAVAYLLITSSAGAEIVIDGVVAEPEWQEAESFRNFLLVQPYTLASTGYDTEARILGTPGGINIAFLCEHPPGVVPQQERMPRDSVKNGERINIYVDFDADAKVAYVITITIAGSVQDGTMTNENVYSTDWDGEFGYAVASTKHGWSVEVRLPWTIASMKEQPSTKRKIAVAFDRVVSGTDERSATNGLTFTLRRFISDFQKVEIDQFNGSLVHAFPYAVVGRDMVKGQSITKLGMDVVWRSMGNFQLAGALNPDFGQVEADELIVNFDAIEVLFSDKRPFFSEGNGLFDVRLGEFDRLLYTRRVGGARDSNPSIAANIDAAVKMNGSVGKLEYGFMSAVEDEYTEDLDRAFLAQRARVAGDHWSVGYLGTWTDRPFFDRTSQLHSSDIWWRPRDWFMLQTELIASLIEQKGTSEGGDGGLARVLISPSEAWQHEWSYLHYSNDLNFNDFGFQQRSSLNEATYVLERRFREFAALDQRAAVTWRVRPRLRWNDAGQEIGHQLALYREAKQKSGAALVSSLRMASSGMDDITSRGNGVFSVGARLLGLSHSYQSPRYGRWRMLGMGTLLQEGERDYAFEAESKLEHFTTAHLNWSLRAVRRWSRDWLIWREDNLLASYSRNQMLLACDVNWLPAMAHELRLKLQWLGMKAYDPIPMRIDPSGHLVESSDEVLPFRISNLGIQLRYRWSFGAQSDLYLVYGRGGVLIQEGYDSTGLQRLFESAADLRDDDTVLVKLRYRI